MYLLTSEWSTPEYLYWRRAGRFCCRIHAMIAGRCSLSTVALSETEVGKSVDEGLYRVDAGFKPGGLFFFSSLFLLGVLGGGRCSLNVYTWSGAECDWLMRRNAQTALRKGNSGRRNLGTDQLVNFVEDGLVLHYCLVCCLRGYAIPVWYKTDFRRTGWTSVAAACAGSKSYSSCWPI